MTQPLTETVAGEVRAELGRRNISRVELAARLGISRTALWNRLRGETEFSISELEKVAEFLGVPVSQFVSPVSTRGAA